MRGNAFMQKGDRKRADADHAKARVLAAESEAREKRIKRKIEADKKRYEREEAERRSSN
jgi:hypothetical protein